MYTEFFHLSARPFQLTPDPRFFFGSTGHKRAMAHLTYGLHQAEGFIVITGEVGAGKTTLVDLLLSQLDRARSSPPRSSRRNWAATTCCAWSPPASASTSRAWTRRRCCAASRTSSWPNMRARQALASDRRRGAEPVVRGARRAAHAVELRGRQDDAAAELPARPAAIPRDHGERPELEQLRQRVIASYHLGPLTKTRPRPISSTGCAGRLAGRSGAHRRLLSAVIFAFGRRAAAHQHAVLARAALRLSRRAARHRGRRRRPGRGRAADAKSPSSRSNGERRRRRAVRAPTGADRCLADLPSRLDVARAESIAAPGSGDQAGDRAHGRATSQSDRR